MAASALEEKINKIRQQNEEIRRRHEEVEEDKKNAAKLNALVQMVPSTDWPERKEPPEFSNPPKPKPKPTKEKHEYIPQSHTGEGKKVHSFAQGEGPPPDPKYNFLADSEREEPSTEYAKESSGNRSHHKATRGNFRKKIGGRDLIQKDSKPNKGNYRDDSQPGYDAWRAERNRIDEDRISRQRTAEGNWRREWDNDKVHIIDDVTKKSSRSTLGDFAKKDHKDADRRYHANNNEHVNYSRGGGHRGHRGSAKNFYSNYESRSHNTYDQHRSNTAAPPKTPVSPTTEERTVVATEKSIKVTVNQGNATKGPLMSVKVNSPSIAGTGRVGPRQRTRITYSHSDADAAPTEGESFHRQKSFEDKSKAGYFNNQKFSNLKRSHSQKKKENDTKYQHVRKDSDGNSHKHYEGEFRSHAQKDQPKPISAKSPKLSRGNTKIAKHSSESSNADISQMLEIQDSSTSDAAKVEQNIDQNAKQNIENNVEQNVDTNAETNVEMNIENNVEQNVDTNVETNVEMNIKNNVEQNVEATIRNNVEANIEINAKSNIENNVERNVEANIEINAKANIENNVEQNVEANIRNNVEANIEINAKSNIENNVERNVEANIEINAKANIENNVEQNVEASIRSNVEANTEINAETNIENNVEVNIDGNAKANIENNVEAGIENNVELTIENDNEDNATAEDSESKQDESKSEKIGAVITENEQTSTDNEIKLKELSSSKETEETISTSSVSGANNPERVAKDDATEQNFDKESVVARDLQESNNTSSEALVPISVRPNEEHAPTKAEEKAAGDALKAEEAVSRDEVAKQFTNDGCDNIGGEVKVERSAEDNSVPSLEDETHSVIEINNQSVCNKEEAREEQSGAKDALNAEKEVNGKKEESSEKDLNDVVKCERNSSGENIICSVVDADKNLTEESKEKADETKEGKEENDKTSQ